MELSAWGRLESHSCEDGEGLTVSLFRSWTKRLTEPFFPRDYCEVKVNVKTAAIRGRARMAV